MFEIIGVIVLTLIPLAISGWFLTMLFMQWSWGGFHVLKPRDWVSIMAIGAIQIAMWFAWWVYVGSAVDISVAVS